MKLDEEILKGKQYIDKLRLEYIENHTRFQERDELIAENNIEKRDIKGYHGREILELLQNADDAYQKSIDKGEKPQCELKVTICYKGNVLTVTNTGTCFDEAGIKAIVQGNNSPKSGKYIGNKGTGFRSVLNWAEKVRIFSGNYNVEFSKEIAEKILEEHKENPQIKKQIQKNKNLYIPMLAVPVYIENGRYNDTTTIEVVIDSMKLNDDFSVSRQIENIDLRILLFLPNISQIEIITDDNCIVYRRNNNQGVAESITLEKIVDENVEMQEEFYLYRKVITNAIEEDEVLKDIQLSIAVPLDMDTFMSRYIYSYFPLLDTESPFNCVLHASYALGDHRNTVNVSKENKKIIEEQLLFLVEVANQFVDKEQYDIAYNLLIPTNFSSNKWRFTSPFAKFELEDYYLEILSEQKIFRTVNDENISVKDKPKMISGNYPEFFRDKGFEGLLNSLLDNRMISLIEILAKRKEIDLYFEERELLQIINSLSNDWDIKKQVETFVWWNTRYRKSIPNLLKTQEDKWLKYQEECYFLIGDFDEKGLPSWVKIPALHKEYQQELFNMAEGVQEVINVRERDKEPQISRIICQNNIFPTINFKYRDRSNIISTVNSSVDTYNKAIDFVKWLWGNYRKEIDWNPPGRTEGTRFKYNFPNARDKSTQDGEKLFWGLQYNNFLAEKLFDNSFGQFPQIEVFNISVEESAAFQEFISKFGVRKYPVIEVQNVYPLDSYSNEYENEIKLHGDIGCSTTVTCRYRLPYIKNLVDLLRKLSTREIVEWIIKDSELYVCLSSPFYFQNAKISYYGSRQQVERYYWDKIKNYILEVFNEVRWIEIDGKRYSPRQILQNFRSRNNQRFVGIVPVIGIEMLEKIAEELHVDIGVVQEIFNKFSFGDKITDLSSEDFYGLMLRLPELDFSRSAELSKAIYRIIEQPAFSRKFENSDSKNRFFVEGKILVKYKGQLQYVLAKNAYLPSSKIISKKNVPIVEKGQRTNNRNFVTLFGCQEYTKEYTVDPGSVSISDANSSFQQYYQDFKKYARAYAENNDNIEKYGKNLNINLVNRITILEVGNRITIDEEYMCIRDTMTNWYITVFDKEFDVNTVSEIIENIYTNIANTPGFEASKLGELFRTKDNSNREFLIIKDFGSLSVIEDAFYQNEIRNNFIKVLKIIAPTYEIDKILIDFENFFSIKNGACIISLFREIGTDVEEFRNKGFVYNLDLLPYYCEVLKNFLQTEKRRFKDYLFTRAKSDDKLQKDFVSTVYRFEQFSITKYINSVMFSVEDKVVETFGEWKTSEDVFSADDEYVKNYEKMNPQKLYEDEISNDVNAQQMIYFGKEKAFNEWLDLHKRLEERNNMPENPYSRYIGVIPKVNEVSYHQGASTTGGANTGNRNNKSTGTYTQSHDEKRNRNKKILGNKGELLVYNLLCKRVGKEKVFPRSEAFIELGIIKPGQAVSGGYDISYYGEDGIEYFVEVKTGDGKSFIISPGELQYAKDNAEKYKLIIVYDVDAEEPKCMELPMRFWEDSKFRKREIVERIEFEF